MSPLDVSTARKAAVGHVLLVGGFAVLALLCLFLHGDSLHWRNPNGRRWAEALLTVCAWFALVGALRWRRRRTAASAMRHASALAPAAQVSIEAATATMANATIQVIYASQTGFAEQLAEQTLESLRAGGLTAAGGSMDTLTLDALRSMERVLFIVSTTGEGDPPDVAAAFDLAAMRTSADLSHLRVGLLALGDSDYEDFCGFGRALWHWLQASGAQPLFDLVEVNRGDDAALRHWQHHLAMLAGSSDVADWQTPDYQPWTLLERRCLNPGSVGAACFHVALRPLQGGLSWEAGDLVEIGPCHAAQTIAAWLSRHDFDGNVSVVNNDGQAPLASLLARCRLPPADEVDGLDEQTLASTLQRLPHREYSIASLPDDGALHLLVRQMCGPDGQPGIGSTWLCAEAPIGSQLALRVRRNANFHVPDDARPLILIGNGTGMAALRALIKARVASGQQRNWLLFGERQVIRDFYYHDEIQAWLQSGDIERADFAWSRDQSERVYVQQRLREAGAELVRWVDAGAAIYVCGSLDGMAPGVDLALRDMLGAKRVEQLREQGRYRRDVY